MKVSTGMIGGALVGEVGATVCAVTTSEGQITAASSIQLERDRKFIFIKVPEKCKELAGDEE